MLEGDDVFQKTIEDEQIEIRQKYMPDADHDYSPAKKSNRLRKGAEDRVMRNERDFLEKGLEDSSSAESDYNDIQIDDLDIEELGFLIDEKMAAKGKNVGKKNAIDKSGDTNAQDLEEREDEADDTVFIDNLPKDESSLRQMIKDVNFHIRDLER